MAYSADVKYAWELDGNLTPSQGVVSLTNSGTLTWDTGLYGQCFKNLGANNIITMPIAINNDVKNWSAFTVQYKFNIYQDRGAGYRVVGKRYSTFNQAYDYSTPNFQWLFNTNSASATIGIDTWHNVSIEWNGTLYKVYVDGNLVISYSSTANIFNDSNLFIFGNDADVIYPAYAKIDRIVVSNITYSGVEIFPLPSGAKTLNVFGMPKKRFHKQRLGAI